MNPLRRLVRFRLRTAVDLSRCAIQRWFADQASSIAAALAFYCAFSLAPLLVILIGLISWLVGAERAYGQVQSQLSALFGSSTARVLLDAMKSSQTDGGLRATLLSAITLFIGATSIFAALESALEQIFNTQMTRSNGLWALVRTRLLSFGIILAVGFLLLVSLTLSTAVAALRSYLPASTITALGVMWLIDLSISLWLTTVLIALIYRFMPARRLPWHPVVFGAGITAVLFQTGRWLVGLYLASATQPSAFGAAASFAALLLWLYYNAQIFLLGAEFTACLAGVSKPLLSADAKPARPVGQPSH